MQDPRGWSASQGALHAPSQRTLALIALAAIAATAVLVWFIFANFYGIENPDHTGHFPWLAAGLVWIAVGSLTWTRWPWSRTGPLMVLIGFTHFLYAPGDRRECDSRVVRGTVVARSW